MNDSVADVAYLIFKPKFAYFASSFSLSNCISMFSNHILVIQAAAVAFLHLIVKVCRYSL